jgi:apolipoprotein N-acyltransferase
MPVADANQGWSKWRRWVLAAASGVLLTLLYAPFDLSVLGWIALTPLILALDGVPAGSGCALGWLTGTIGSLGVTGFWMFRAARDYFQLSTASAVAFTIGINQIFVAVYFALFGLAATLLPARRWRFLLLPALFVATEYARAHVLTGNPWALLGQSQHNVALIQLCDLTGVYGLSFLLALSAAAVAELRHTRRPGAAAALGVVLVLIYGEWRLGTDAPRDRLQITMVQANLPNDQRGRPEFFSEHLKRYLDLTRRGSSPPPALIIWPENAIGFFPQENAVLLDRMTVLLRAEHAALLAGAPRAGGRTNVAALYNSAYLFTADGIQGVYDKRVLLPFVERLPLRPDDGPYLAGTAPTILPVAGTQFGTLICYEAIYPALASELVERGAQFLVNISNDSWFEAGAGPEQHYAIARFRAVENHVSLVRVTNSGVSGVIDPEGREIIRLPARQATMQSVAVPIGPGGSFYSQHGDLFAAACCAISIVALGLRLLGALPQ